MPYASIKAYLRDDAVKNPLVEEVNKVFLDLLGCPSEAMTIFIEDVAPEDREEQVQNPDIMGNLDKVKIPDGAKTYW